jgi:2-keto-4-pentenoate hydratase/2-oxohepta-3-ene-1,7-dioic acid hydratase in catechol pathway
MQLARIRGASGEPAAAAGKASDAGTVKFLAPTTPAVFLGLGYNYKALTTHEGLPFNKHPELFAKLPGCAIGHDEPVMVPRVIDKIDFEAELAVVIGRTARRVKAGEALDYVGGYTACNDLTAKIIPRPPESGSVIVPLKCADTFGPMGPTLIPTRLIPDPQKLTMRCRVNGVEKHVAGHRDHQEAPGVPRGRRRRGDPDRGLPRAAQPHPVGEGLRRASR